MWDFTILGVTEKNYKCAKLYFEFGVFLVVDNSRM